MAKAQSAVDYTLISFMVSSHKHDLPIELAASVDEIELFENMDLPYLTGSFTMKDDMRFYDGVNVNGTEKITIIIKSPQDDNFMTKTFSILGIPSATKSADNIEAMEIKIIENNCFNDNLMQINKAYTGTPDIIIAKILKDNLNIDLDLPAIKPYQKTMKVVIPHMTPFAACRWICSSMSTDLGLPYFLFATLNDKNLQLRSLEEILRNPAWNQDSPYRYSAAYNQTSSGVDADLNAFNVSAYTSHNKESVFNLVNSGATAGSRSITDMTSGQLINYDFNIDTVFQDLSEMQIIDDDHQPVFHSRYRFNGKEMNEYNNYNAHGIIATNTYNGVANIHEETSTGAFKLAASKRALKSMMIKTSINIRVPGIMFLTGTNASLGRQIDFMYPANNTSVTNRATAASEDITDTKRSGTYVIYTTRHHFNNTQHNVDMSCVKLGNRK